ncbi:MAG: M23 family metallopeptidase [Anaerolineae bacterium]|nr:M23 family metallopeptidase [Gemmatimonadaceae bacterium]
MKTAIFSLCIASMLTACEIIPKDKTKQDTTTAIADSNTLATSRPLVDSTDTLRGVPAIPSDSSVRTTTGPDTGVVTVFPDTPRRGGVVWISAEGFFPDAPHCTWKGAALPCYRTGSGVQAIVPLSADAPAGTYSFTIDRPAGRITRQITVTNHDFGRELIFLDSIRYALVKRTADISRDARTLRQLLRSESPERHWTGDWRPPLARGSKSSAYGVERFYFPASDSSRSVTVAASLRVRGAFAADTLTSPATDAPGWRHAGVDIAMARRALLRAPAAAMVAEVGDYTLSGRTLILDHGQGVLSAYFYLDTVLVRRGELVARADQIARAGSTGLSTGPHLHYGIYVHGEDVDPVAWAEMPKFARGEAKRP